MKNYTTSCPRNCTSTCSMIVDVEDDRIRRLRSHPDNKATHEGLCLKGLSYLERYRASDRLLKPLKRVSASGDFEEIDWEEALSTITEKLRTFKNESGPQSILFYAGSGTKGLLNGVSMDFWHLFGGCTTTYGDLCWPAGLEATRLTLGENKHNAPWDLENARLIVLWGKNPAATNIHQMKFIHKAQNNGAKLVVIDPRRTESAERSEVLIQPVPGTDGALALAIAREMIWNQWIDEAFISKYVKGFDAYREKLKPYSAAWAHEISGVPAQMIQKLALWMGTIKPATIVAGFGMQRFSNGGQTLRCLISLLALTGNIGRPGAGWQYANLQSHIFDSLKDPQACYPNPGNQTPIRTSISTARLGADMLKQRNPRLRMAWVERGNPVTTNPETSKILQAFRGLEFRVVVDQFLTDTAREADLVLPAKTLFEQTDVIHAYWHPFIQIKQKVIPPPGLVKPESEIYHALAKKLSLPLDDLDHPIPEPSDASIEKYLQIKLSEFVDFDLDRLKHGPVLVPGHETVAFSDLVFSTPSGKIEIESQNATQLWNVDALPGYNPPKEHVSQDSCGKTPFMLLTPNSKNRIHSQFQNLKTIKQINSSPRVFISSRDAGERGVLDDDWVLVFNDRGSLRIRAKLDASLLPGCLSISNGWWQSDGSAVNNLTLGRETDMGHGAAFHDICVDVRKA